MYSTAERAMRAEELPVETYDAIPIFDFHTHCFPDAIAQRTIEALSGKAGISACHDGTAGGLRAYQRAHGTVGHLILPISTKPSQTQSILDIAARLDRQDGVRSLGSVHPFDPDFETWLDRAADLGLAGIKLHPEYQDFYVDDEKVFPVYEEIFRRGMLLVLHAGADLGYDPPVHGTPKRIAALCDRFPEGKIVAAHMGGFMFWDEAYEHLAGRKNLWLDCSYAAGVMPDAQFAALARAHGVDRILFGTDSPWRTLPETLAAVHRVGFSKPELRRILYDNAMKLLGT